MTDTDYDYESLLGRLATRFDPIIVQPDELAREAAEALSELLAERDALRAQLDGMTTEWSTLKRDMVSEWHTLWDTEEEARESLRRSPLSVSIEKRRVGPWVEVTD